MKRKEHPCVDAATPFAELFEVINGVVFYRVHYRKRLGYESVNMERHYWLPFVPVPGQFVAPVKGDDLWEVEDVHYIPGDPINVWFKDSDHSVEYMREMGWTEEVLPEPEGGR